MIIDTKGATYTEGEFNDLISMPSGSEFNVLSLKGSSVTRLPSGIKARLLDLTESKLTSIGQNIKVHTLYILTPLTC